MQKGTIEIYLNTILENMEGYVWCLDKEKRYVYFNTRLQQFIQESFHITIQRGDPVYNMGDSKDRSYIDEWEKVYEEGFQGVTQHLVHSFPLHGRQVYLELRLKPVVEDQRVVGIICMGKDITDQVGCNQPLLMHPCPLPYSDDELQTAKIENGSPLGAVMVHQVLYQKRKTLLAAVHDLSQTMKLQQEMIQQRSPRQKEIMEAVVDTWEKLRAEIGRELHDNVNQMLTSAKLYLEFALDKTIPTRELVQKTRGAIEDTIEEIRRLTQTLVPPPLKETGLKEAITELIGSMNMVAGDLVKCEISGLREDRLDESLQLSIYRIAQEQLNNTLKYAEASKIKLLIHQIENSLELVIEDNGKGFDTRLKRKGIGFNNIITRAECFGGQVRIESTPGKGCRLWVQFPLG
jgi:signal transduction histidine kinase